ncbi:MAG TPA: vWA domain-containing protein [Pirellulales bacterium]|nr:vWA domain-containing protein [Pirellulales bacterium]
MLQAAVVLVAIHAAALALLAEGALTLIVEMGDNQRGAAAPDGLPMDDCEPQTFDELDASAGLGSGARGTETDAPGNGLASVGAGPLAAAMAASATLTPEAELQGLGAPAELLDAAVSPDQVPGAQLNQVVVRDGALGFSFAHIDGAVDCLADEILTNLEESKVLVVWIMDASISLEPDRQAVAQRLEKIYNQLTYLGDMTRGALTSAVVAFGERAEEMVPPTTDYGKVIDAIRHGPTDKSGIENVFSTVVDCVNRYQKQRSREHRRVLFVIWTDESGNDNDKLEDAVKLCRNTVTPVYVVGPSAMFGKQKGTMPFKHVDGKVYQLPVDRGPDTVRQERLNLPYWFEGDQYETLHAGVGPFALTRLAHETGGGYFIKDHEGDKVGFSVESMLGYMPDYDSPLEYTRHASKSPLRRAVLTAVDLTHERKLKGTPRLRFAPNGQTYFQELREAQETVAFNLMTIQQALAVFGPKGMEPQYAKEESARWRAWYDLTYGRLLAMCVRCNEYNWACAVMKGKGADFVEKKSNRWEFRADEALHSGSQNERMAKEATRLLTRCSHDNPGTPWALLAQRELEKPLGFIVHEAYEAPPPPPPKPKADPKKPVKPPPPPPPPPPSKERRMEMPKKLEKPVEVPLPKL